MINNDQVKWILAHDRLVRQAMDLTIDQTISPTFSIPRFNLMAQQEVMGKMTTGTGNRTQKLKYLGVEMLKKDATKASTPESGLFRGIRERSDGAEDAKQVIKMILIGAKDKENDIKALNLAIFNVLSIKMLYGDTKELVVFKSNEADQTEAMSMLEAAMAEFVAEKRMVDNDPEIIDIKTFEDVPQEFFSPQDKTAGATGNNYGYGNHGAGACGHQNDDWKVKQEEREKEKERQEKLRWTPTLIKRKGTLPALKVLNAIKKKVAAIASGEYDAQLKDPDPTDTVDADGKKTQTAK
jgi:hypothetical protein